VQFYIEILLKSSREFRFD